MAVTPFVRSFFKPTLEDYRERKRVARNQETPDQREVTRVLFASELYFCYSLCLLTGEITSGPRTKTRG